MSNTTFLVGRHTAKTFMIEPASRVGPSQKKGCFSLTRLRRSEETLEHSQVMGAIGHALRELSRCQPHDLNLKRVFEHAKTGPYGHLMSAAHFAGPTSSGVPARIIVKGTM